MEVDSTGLIKVNPLFSWTFAQVKAYVDEHNVPRNALLAQGYRSVGDWHSTIKSGDGDSGERAGRWAGKEKTECGLHQDYFKMKLLAMKKKVSGSFQTQYKINANLSSACLEGGRAPIKRRGEAGYRARISRRRSQLIDH